jgi:hypothetical protein
MYQPEGRQLAKKLYEETLEELSFAGVQGITNDMSVTASLK